MIFYSKNWREVCKWWAPFFFASIVYSLLHLITIILTICFHCLVHKTWRLQAFSIFFCFSSLFIHCSTFYYFFHMLLFLLKTKWAHAFCPFLAIHSRWLQHRLSTLSWFVDKQWIMLLPFILNKAYQILHLPNLSHVNELMAAGRIIILAFFTWNQPNHVLAFWSLGCNMFQFRPWLHLLHHSRGAAAWLDFLSSVLLTKLTT